MPVKSKRQPAARLDPAVMASLASAPARTSDASKDIPGLTRVRMLMHELKDNVHDALDALNVWTGGGHATLRESSAAAEACRETLTNTFRQTWLVARELSSAGGGGYASGGVRRDSTRLSMTFVQCAVLSLYMGDGMIALLGDHHEMMTIALACLAELAAQGSAGEQLLDSLADGFPILCSAMEEATRTEIVGEDSTEVNSSVREALFGITQAYTQALTSLASAAVNRRKVFSIALAKLLPSCLFIPLRPAAEAQGTVASSFLPQWSQAVDGLLEASIFDEKSVDELSKGHLPSTAVGISSILPVEIARSEAPGNRPTTYVAELYAVVARAFVDRPYKAPSSLFALDAGMERIINVFLSLTLGKLATDAAAAAGEQALVAHRKACVKALHFGLSMVEACSSTGEMVAASESVLASTASNQHDELVCRVQSRSVLLRCLSDQFIQTAIPDHPSLAKYSELLRTLFQALMKDLGTASKYASRSDELTSVKAKKTKTTHQVADITLTVETATAAMNSLLFSVRSLVRIDHRPVMAAPHDASVADENIILRSLIRHLSCSQGRGNAADDTTAAGAELLLVTLIELHQDLRLVPSLIKALSTGLSTEAGSKLGSDALTDLLHKKSVQSLLTRVFRSMPGVQLGACWEVVKVSFFSSSSRESGELPTLCALGTLNAWVGPLADVYIASDGVGASSTALKDAPLGNVWLPLLQEMSRSVDLYFHQSANKDSGTKGKKRDRSELQTAGIPPEETRFRVSVLSILERISYLCATFAPHSSALVHLQIPIDVDGARSDTLEEWGDINCLASDLLGRLSEESNAPVFWVDSGSAVQSLLLSCGLNLFTLLVTMAAVKDSKISLRGDTGVDPSECLSSIIRLCCKHASSSDVSLLLLEKLPVWSHLMGNGGNEANGHSDAIVEASCAGIVEHIFRGASDRGNSTASRQLQAILDLLCTGSLLEHRPLLDALARGIAGRSRYVSNSPWQPSEELCFILQAIPGELMMICLEAGADKEGLTLRDCLHSYVVGTVHEMINASSVVAILSRYYHQHMSARTEVSCVEFAVNLAVAVFSSGLDEVADSTIDLLLLLLHHSLLNSFCNAEELESILTVVINESHVGYIVPSPTPKAAEKLKKKTTRTLSHTASITSSTRSKLTFLRIYKCTCNAVVMSAHRSQTDNSALVLRMFASFAEVYLRESEIELAASDLSVKNMLVGGDIVVNTLRVLEGLETPDSAADSVGGLSDVTRQLLNRSAVIQYRLIGVDASSAHDQAADVSVNDQLQYIGTSLLMLSRVEPHQYRDYSCRPDATLMRILQLVAGSHSFHFSESENISSTIDSFRFTCRVIFLNIYGADQLLLLSQFASNYLLKRACSADTNGGSSNEVSLLAALAGAVSESLVQSILDDPDRVVSRDGATVVSVLSSAINMVQTVTVAYGRPAAVLTGGDAVGSACCFAMVSSLHHVLSMLQQYQQKRTKARYAGRSKGRGKTKRAAVEEREVSVSSKDSGSDQLHGHLQDMLDIWAQAALQASSHWLCSIGLIGDYEQSGVMFQFIDRLMGVIELGVSIQSDTHLNTTGGMLSMLLREAVAVLCSGVERYQDNSAFRSKHVYLALTNAIRQCSRLVAGLASCRALQKYIHLFGAVIVDTFSSFPSVCNASSAQGAVGSTSAEQGSASVDVMPLMAGLFCMFDRCKTSKQRLMMFAALGNNNNGVGNAGGAAESRMLMSELHETYLREYKFVGMA